LRFTFGWRSCPVVSMSVTRIGRARPSGTPRSSAPGRGDDHAAEPVDREESTQTDEQYEGCLSFFDVRGRVPRPVAMHVDHRDIDGQRRITIFDRGIARLVAHEVNHLDGVLYRERMRPGVEPIPVTEYRQGGRDWRYGG
jgi:peptide deformylase